jgi:hypothetical protein
MARPPRVALLLAILVAGSVGPAFPFGLDGKKLMIKKLRTGTKLVFTAYDRLVDPGSAGGAGDPRCYTLGGGGGALRVNGGPGNDFTIPLPCYYWSQLPSEAYWASYRYKDPDGTTCQTITIKHGKYIKATCGGPQIGYTFGAPAGDIDVTLRTGGGTPVRQCARFGPAPTEVKRDGSDGESYYARKAPASPFPCPSSPSAAFL